MRLFKKILKPRGIGFLEMIVALGVIVTGVIGGMTLTASNLVSSSASESRLLAANFAREAVEVVRNKRDSNWLASADWFSGILQSDNNYRLITSFNSAANNWSFTDQTVNLNQCSACQIYYHPATGVFSHNAQSGALTTYKRLITLSQICWQEEINEETILAEGQKCSEYQNVTWVGWEVKAEVSWQEGTGSHLLTVIDRIYNWK